MGGLGLRIQIGRTTITPRRCHPAYWFETSLMNPKLYGFGIWVTRDLWHQQPDSEEGK